MKCNVGQPHLVSNVEKSRGSFLMLKPWIKREREFSFRRYERPICIRSYRCTSRTGHTHTHIHIHKLHLCTHTTHTHTHIHTDRHVCPRTCEHVDAEDGFVRSSTERQQNANARIIYAKFARRRARGERAWQNAKYRMQNANRAVDSIGESEVKIGPTMIEGGGWWRGQGTEGLNGLRDLDCTADSIDSKSGQAFVISQIVRHIIFRFRLVRTFETPR